MPLESILFISYTSLAIAISTIITVLFWQRRAAVGAATFTLIMACAVEWSVSSLISALSSSLNVKIIWDNLTYLGIVIIPVAWFVFSLQYTNRERYATRRNIILLSIIPVLTTLFIWTNPLHHLFEINTNLVKVGSLSITEPTYQFWLYVHLIYSYLLILIGTTLLITKLAHQSKIYRKQSIIMIFAAITPFIGSILFNFDIPAPGIDTTILSFSVTGILCFWGMFRYKLFDLIPAAREAVIESIDELIIVLDKQNRIIDINTSAIKAINSNISELIGKPVLSVLGDRAKQFLKYADTSQINEKIFFNDENNKKCFDFRILPLYDSKNRINGRFIVAKDITILEEAMENLKKSRKEAENSSKAKSQFLATMSHEIRTPLNGIIGMAELLSSAKLTEEEMLYLKTIQSSAHSLLDIINDILDFSKIEAGKMELENTNFNLRNLLGEITKAFIYQENEKGIKLICDTDGNIPENLYGDSVRLRQILMNLLGNAFKFTKRGSITLKTEMTKTENNQVTILFKVSDTGIGIPEDKINSLFGSFQQLDNSTSRKYGGTGLGLAIVKNLVAMMGGSINVESKPGEGSSFYFEIKLQTADEQITEKTKVKKDIEFFSEDCKILLAEDNKVNQLFMVKLLEKKKLNVDVAESGKEVLEKIDKNTYDLILMDIQMPEMDGYEATEKIRLRENLTGQHIPIIALTANATEEDRDKSFQSGMDDYLSKPVKSAVLYSYLEKYLK